MSCRSRRHCPQRRHLSRERLRRTCWHLRVGRYGRQRTVRRALSTWTSSPGQHPAARFPQPSGKQSAACVRRCPTSMKSRLNSPADRFYARRSSGLVVKKGSKSRGRSSRSFQATRAMTATAFDRRICSPSRHQPDRAELAIHPSLCAAGTEGMDRPAPAADLVSTEATQRLVGPANSRSPGLLAIATSEWHLSPTTAVRRSQTPPSPIQATGEK